MDTIGVGIIGASPGGSWAAHTHVPALQALPDYELRAVATSRRESADAAAAAYGMAAYGIAAYDLSAYDNAAELIADPGVDLVVVAVKVPQHFELISQALAAGKMVYSEWPLGVDLAQATELAARAASAGVRTVIGLQGRYAPAIRHAAELVAGGALGRILSTALVGSGAAWGAVTDRSHAYLYDSANGATTLTAAAMHALDAAAFVLGEPMSVEAAMSVGNDDVRLIEDGSPVTVTAPDQVAVLGTLAGGAVLSSFYRGGVSPAENFRWAITGTDGELVLTSSTSGNGNIQAIDLHLSGAFGADIAIADIPVPDRDEPAVAALGSAAGNVARLYAALASDVRGGVTTVPDFGYALTRHRLVDAIQNAADRMRVRTMAD
jgi:predicted dehydrogenase